MRILYTNDGVLYRNVWFHNPSNLGNRPIISIAWYLTYNGTQYSTNYTPYTLETPTDPFPLQIFTDLTSVTSAVTLNLALFNSDSLNGTFATVVLDPTLEYNYF